MNNAEQAIQHIESQVAQRPPPNVADMLQAVIERGVTTENVAALDSMVKLYERMEDRKHEQEFASAFVALQAEMPKVQAIRAVPNNDGSVRYRFAPYEEIMKQVGPLLQKHGFTVTFSTEVGDGRVTKICTLQHTGGHKRSNNFTVRVGKGPPSASESQADGAAHTYAKRGALADALNIIVDHDDDARVEGAAITRDQADELERRVNETNSDKKAFLLLAGAASFSEIGAAKYEILDSLLRKKERMGR